MQALFWRDPPRLRPAALQEQGFERFGCLDRGIGHRGGGECAAVLLGIGHPDARVLQLSGAGVQLPLPVLPFDFTNRERKQEARDIAAWRRILDRVLAIPAALPRHRAGRRTALHARSACRCSSIRCGRSAERTRRKASGFPAPGHGRSPPCSRESTRASLASPAAFIRRQ